MSKEKLPNYTRDLLKKHKLAMEHSLRTSLAKLLNWKLKSGSVSTNASRTCCLSSPNHWQKTWRFYKRTRMSTILQITCATLFTYVPTKKRSFTRIWNSQNSPSSS